MEQINSNKMLLTENMALQRKSLVYNLNVGRVFLQILKSFTYMVIRGFNEW